VTTLVTRFAVFQAGPYISAVAVNPLGENWGPVRSSSTDLKTGARRSQRKASILGVTRRSAGDCRGETLTYMVEHAARARLPPSLAVA
jgi:hypothetical protein